MAKNTLLGVWVDPDLKKQIQVYVRAHQTTTSELGRLLFTGLLMEKNE
jgi:hypothetical protein